MKLDHTINTNTYKLKKTKRQNGKRWDCAGDVSMGYLIRIYEKLNGFRQNSVFFG